MKLTPYPKHEKRWHKVYKHAFNPGERWWELAGGLEHWNRDWNALRVRGFFNGDTPWLQAGTDPNVREIVERWHEIWIEAAGRAVDQAKARRQVEPQADGRRSYVGDKGVTVILAGPDRLVTCYKIVHEAVHSERASERAAVRRQQRRASL